jgi:hypothetical protein
MELQTLFKRESVADPFSIRIMQIQYILLLQIKALFHTNDLRLAGWKTGSKEIVGLKMAVR